MEHFAGLSKSDIIRCMSSKLEDNIADSSIVRNESSDATKPPREALIHTRSMAIAEK